MEAENPEITQDSLSCINIPWFFNRPDAKAV